MTELEKLTKQAELRKKAEALMKNKSIQDLKEIDTAETLKLLHEIEVHQIELEIVNQELIEAKKESDFNAAKYLEFFDFAPVSCFILSAEKVIHEVNIYAARLLGIEKIKIASSAFNSHLKPSSIETFNEYFNFLVENNHLKNCELTIVNSSNKEIEVLCYGIMLFSKNQFLISLIDISKQVCAEREVKKHQDHLEEIVRLRTKELEDKNAELINFNKLFVGRELRIKELKNIVRELECKLRDPQ